MRLSFDQSLTKLCEPALRRRVVTEVADLNHQAGDQIRIGRNLQDRRRAGQLGEPVAKGVQLALVERERPNEPGRELANGVYPRWRGPRGSPRPRYASRSCRLRTRRNRNEQARGAIFEELDAGCGLSQTRKPADEARTWANRGLGCKHVAVELGKLVEHLVDGPLALGRLDQGFGIAASDFGGIFGHGRRLLRSAS